MSLTTCPHCGRQVLPASDGVCPSCRQSLGDAQILAAEVVTAEVVPVTIVSPAELDPRASAAPQAAATAAASAPRPGAGALVLVPAILLCIVSLLSSVNSLVMIFSPEPRLVKVSDDPEVQEAYVRGQAISGIARSPIILVLHLVALVGGVAMFKREKWGLALAGAIIEVLPVSPLCIGMPIGIWAIAVLNLPRVKAQFRG